MSRLIVCLVLVATALLGAPPAGAQPPVIPTAPPTTTPNTDACPYATRPAPPRDASEVPAPGQTVPAARPVADPPVGGLGRCGVDVPAGAPGLPAGLTAAGWVVVDLDSGEVLAAKDPHGRYRPASTIKLLTASLALSRLDLGTVVTGTRADADAEGSEVGIGPGGRYTVRDLLLGLLLASGNDAAHALAVQLGGVAETVAADNELARSLGATDTRVITPSGLDGPGTSTSPYDLALFLRHALDVPGFTELNLTRETLFPGYLGKPSFPVANDNQLVLDYNGVLGAKNGFTDDARHTFAGAAERGGRRLGVTLMQAERAPRSPVQQAAALLDWGFSLPAGTPDVGTLVDGPPRDPAAVDRDPTVTATPTPAPALGRGARTQAAAKDSGGSGSDVVALLAGGFAVLLGVVAIVAALRRDKHRRDKHRRDKHRRDKHHRDKHH